MAKTDQLKSEPKKFFTKNCNDFSDILDESSNFAPVLTKEDGSALLNKKMRTNNFDDQSKNQSLEVQRLNQKCERLEKENSVLILNNQDLRSQIKRLSSELQTLQHSGTSNSNVEMLKLKTENERLGDLLVQLQSKYSEAKLMMFNP